MKSEQDKANPPPIVMSLYDLTGKFVEPWAKAGYDCYCVDIQHPKGTTSIAENVTFIGADMRDWMPPRSIGNPHSLTDINHTEVGNLAMMSGASP